MLLFSAAFALFAVAGIAVIGFLIFAFFWAKAKISGKPFGPRAMMDAQLNQMRKDPMDGLLTIRLLIIAFFQSQS